MLGQIRAVLSTRNSRISRAILALLAMMRGLLVICGFYGAQRLPSRNSAVNLYKLNRTTSLGAKDELVELPKDRIINNYVRQRGSWELDECKFLVSELQALENHMNETGKILFLDIGANAGLISRQVRTLLDRDIEMILIEPIPLHVEVIKFNLSKFLPDSGIQIFQGALSNVDGTSKIYIQKQNRGNTSLFKDAMLGHSSEEIQIDLINMSKFSQRYLSHYSHIVLKSDTQGFEARILSLIPFITWENIRAAVIEVWALPEIDEDEIAKLISIWEKLPHLKFSSSSNPLHSLTLAEIKQFWSSKSGKSLNLRLTSMSST